MLTQDELTAWYEQLHLSQQARMLIDHVRATDPARRVGGGHANVSGQYPSRKMGVTIQFESHRVELPAIRDMEYDGRVVEFYDQPPAMTLDYQSATGKRLVVRHTPDFFVLRKDSAGWEEWKTEEELHRLAEHNANRYQPEGTSWRCPPGEAYAEQFGLTYRVRSSKEIHWGFQRNIQFLEDYLRSDRDAVPSATRERIRAYAYAHPAISLADFLQHTADVATADDIYFLVAVGFIYVDLYAAPLVEPAAVRVFPNIEAALSNETLQGYGTACHPPDPLPQNLCAGAVLIWDGRPWRIANIGQTMISLLGEDANLLELSQSAVESLFTEGRIAQPAADRERGECRRVSDKLLHANEQDLKIANRRAEIVRRRLAGEPLPEGEGASARTLRRWIAGYRSAESNGDIGYIGLLPQIRRRGNFTTRLPQGSARVMDEIIETDYESVKQKSRVACWATMKETCVQRGLPAPSYATFCLAVRNRSAFKQTLKRQGPRAAYQHGPFYFELDLKTPRHGDRPFEICHIDHTLLDIELIDSTGKHVLGRPWMTLVMDAFSRRVLAVYVDFDEPSYRSCMMALRECVRLHSRLPQCLVVDWGPEFGSTYFEALLARYECIKKNRPPAKPRFGSVIERIFGTTNTQFVHDLLGNTQITRNVRQVTKSVNPKELATWPLSAFVDQLCRYLYEVYDTNVHPALGQSPREAYQEGFQNSGQRLQRLIPYDYDFMIATLPSTLKGTAMISPGRGVKINYLIYWSEAMGDPKVQRQQVPVRFDPFDLSTAYAFIGGQWVQCHSAYYGVFQGRSQKELLIISQELRTQNKERGPQFQISAARLAQVFQDVNSQESVFVQRLRASESQAARQRFVHSDSCQLQGGPLAGGADSVLCDDLISKDTQTYGAF
jgi:transposase InsO family protein